MKWILEYSKRVFGHCYSGFFFLISLGLICMIGFANMSVEAVDHGGVNRGHRTGTPPIVCTVTPEQSHTPTLTPTPEQTNTPTNTPCGGPGTPTIATVRFLDNPVIAGKSIFGEQT